MRPHKGYAYSCSCNIDQAEWANLLWFMDIFAFHYVAIDVGTIISTYFLLSRDFQVVPISSSSRLCTHSESTCGSKLILKQEQETRRCARGVSAQGGVCPGMSAQGGVCLGGVCPGDGVCPGVSVTPAPHEQNHRHLWKHYLVTTTSWMVIRKHSSNMHTISLLTGRGAVWGGGLLSKGGCAVHKRKWHHNSSHRGQNASHTLLKILPCPKLRLRAAITYSSYMYVFAL